jgi:hypothetical protein
VPAGRAEASLLGILGATARAAAHAASVAVAMPISRHPET